MTENKNKKIKEAKWTGTAFILGVPSRTLTPEEYKKFKDQIDESEKASKLELYVLIYEDEETVMVNKEK